MSETIQLDPNQLSAARRELIPGHGIEIFPSPYDVPSKVVVEYQKKDETIYFTFVYMNNTEEKEFIFPGNRTSLGIGRKSRRLYVTIVTFRPTIQRESYITDCVASAVSSIESLEARDAHGVRRFNYLIAKEILSRVGAETIDRITRPTSEE
jgi:hypothetical protein